MDSMLVNDRYLWRAKKIKVKSKEECIEIAKRFTNCGRNMNITQSQICNETIGYRLDEVYGCTKEVEYGMSDKWDFYTKDGWWIPREYCEVLEEWSD